MSDVVNSKPFKIFGGIVVAAAGFATGQPWLVAAGAHMWASGVADSLREGAGSPTAAERENGRLLNVMSNEASIPVIYGRTKVGCQILDVRLHPSDTNVLYVVAGLCLGSEDGSGIEDVDGIYLDERLAISNPVFESEPSTSGVQTAFANRLSYGLHAGADAQAVDAELDSVFSAYDSDTVGRGVAYLVLKLTYDPDVYPMGIPTITAIVKGNKVWDPRGTPAWAYSDSPALCILDYLTSKRFGAGVLYGERDSGASEIDEQSFIDAANYHDDSVQPGDPGSGTRFTCNGRLDTAKPIATNLQELLSSCRSELVYEGGKYRLVTPQVLTAETFEITPANVIGEVEYWRGGVDQVPNRVVCHYVDDENEWLPQELTWPEANQSNGFLTADNGFENVLELSLPFTCGYYRAQQIGMVLLREAREDSGIVLTTTEEGLKLRVGEVVRVTLPRAGLTQAEYRVRMVGLTADNLTRLVLAEYDDDAYDLDAQNTRDTLPAAALPDSYRAGAVTLHRDTSARSHTGNTTLTTKQSAQVPALYRGGVRGAVRVRAVFEATGTGGTKTAYVSYGAGAGWSVTIPTGNQVARLDVLIEAVGSNGIQVTDLLATGWPSQFLSSPFTVDVPADVDFDVQLANAGDSISLTESEIDWLAAVQ